MLEKAKDFWRQYRLIILSLVGISVLLLLILDYELNGRRNLVDGLVGEKQVPEILTTVPSPISESDVIDFGNLPQAHVIPGRTHVFQTFNNCGPASLSMALSYYDVNVTQADLGRQLRPYQNSRGDNDDKSVTLEELARKAQEYGLVAYHRPSGSMETLRRFIAYDMPVITRTWTKVGEDIGHYRLVRGYDETAGVIIQDDSLQNKNLRFSYEEFNKLWEAFNYEYLVLVKPENVEIAEAILGEMVEPGVAWQAALARSDEMIRQQSDNVYGHFNKSVAHYELGEYQLSVEAYEQVESRLPFRMLWYQIEPILAYYQLGEYARVFEITDRILNNHNRAFSELYEIRGNIYERQGQQDLAQEEYEKAGFYNRNYEFGILL